MNVCVIRLILLLAAPLLPASPAISAESSGPLPPEPIPVLAWGGPPEAETTEERYRELAAAGFTHNFSNFSSLASMTKALDVAQAAGIKQFVCIPELEREPEDTARKLSAHPALAGYYLRDEPSASDFDKLGKWASRIDAVDSRHPAYINLFPNYANSAQLGTATYQEYLDAFIAKVPVKFVSFDHYPVVGNALRPEWYENLELVSAAARKAKKPFWAFALAVAHNPYPIATIEHLRLQVFSNLACGAQGIQYFTYWTSKSDVWNFHEAPIGVDGKKTAVYDRVKQVNQEIKNLSPVFRNAKVLRLGHTGTPPRGTRAWQPSAPVSKVETSGKNALVSHLENGSRRFLILVNSDFLHAMSYILAFDESAEIRDFRKDGTTGEVIGREWKGQLAPGDIAVAVWNSK